MATDLEKIWTGIQNKAPRYQKLEQYRRGNQPQVYLTARLREIFRGVDIQFNENFCGVVTDTLNDRIQLTGFKGPDDNTQNLLDEAWSRNMLEIESSDIHADAGTTGECYAIAWPDADTNKAEVYYNAPECVHVIYDGEHPRKIALAGKLFQDANEKSHITLYYADRLEYYISDKKLADIQEISAFRPDAEQSTNGRASNPYGKIPVFHFKTGKYCTSDLADVIPLQNGLNKLLSDMMVAAEYGAFQQRYIISESDTSQLKNAPNEIWSLPIGSQAGQFTAADLKNYLDAIDRLSQAIGVISRTPKHYLYSQGGDPSGEALIALEAPLNKKAKNRIARFIPVWRDLAAFVCQIEGIAINPSDITPQFDEPETIQPVTESQIILNQINAGIPLITSLRWNGYSEAEIAVLEADQATAKAAQKASLASAMLEAERQARQAAMNNPQPGNTQPPVNPNMNNQGGNNG